jgi:hypothetical protein
LECRLHAKIELSIQLAYCFAFNFFAKMMILR